MIMIERIPFLFFFLSKIVLLQIYVDFQKSAFENQIMLEPRNFFLGILISEMGVK